MRRAGRVVAELHHEIRAALRPGVATGELDRVAREVLERRGAGSNFLGYHGYPAVICVSPNDMVIHGIPGETVLAEGDLVSVDCGAVVDGWHADAAFSAGVGELDPEATRLIEVAERSLVAAIGELVAGGRLGDVGRAVQVTVEGEGYSVVEEYAGHAIGREMHEDPQVPNVGRRGRGPRIEVGNVFAVEPMLAVGAGGTLIGPDGWSVFTADGSLSAHVEHTIAVTEKGPEILTEM